MDRPPGAILPVAGRSGKPYSGGVRRPWGLRMRVLAAAGLIALVSAITFAVLIVGLADVGSTTLKSRRASDSYTQAGVLERLALEMESAVRGFTITRDDAQRQAFEGARAQVPAAGRKLLSFESEPAERARAAELTRG